MMWMIDRRHGIDLDRDIGNEGIVKPDKKADTKP